MKRTDLEGWKLYSDWGSAGPLPAQDSFNATGFPENVNKVPVASQNLFFNRATKDLNDNRVTGVGHWSQDVVNIFKGYPKFAVVFCEDSIYASIVDDNTYYPATDDSTHWESIASGSGSPIGTIGYTPYPDSVDLKKNLICKGGQYDKNMFPRLYSLTGSENIPDFTYFGYLQGSGSHPQFSTHEGLLPEDLYGSVQGTVDVPCGIHSPSSGGGFTETYRYQSDQTGKRNRCPYRNVTTQSFTLSPYGGDIDSGSQFLAYSRGLCFYLRAK